MNALSIADTGLIGLFGELTYLGLVSCSLDAKSSEKEDMMGFYVSDDVRMLVLYLLMEKLVINERTSRYEGRVDRESVPLCFSKSPELYNVVEYRHRCCIESKILK